MNHLTAKWMVMLMVTLMVGSFVCEKTTATELTETSPVLHAIPKSSQAEKKMQPAGEAISKEPVSEKKENGNDQAPMSEDAPETGNKELADVNPTYEAKSKLDPFMPLIQGKPEIQKPEKPRRVLTPLEKMSLSQIKLVAVVITDSRKIAMVEEASGKGYEVKIGTYIGKNGGQVVDISLDSIIVREIVTDFKGRQTERFQEMKLHKPDNGE